MAGRKPAYRKKRYNRLGLFLVTVCIVGLITVIGVGSMSLSAKQKSLEEKELLLTQQIQDEIERTEQLTEYEKYTKTNAFVEETAKDKLGLVYEREIVFRSN
ncbi:MAG: septum formation initiator family protein [Lachnospiraceae bacterium]|nr:septum formation initiator family protein [Candidatus Merdinaster equi]